MKRQQLLGWAEIYHLTWDESVHPRVYNIPALSSLNIRTHIVHNFSLHFFKINLIYPSVLRNYKQVFPLRLPKKIVFISHFIFVFHLLRRNPNSSYDLEFGHPRCVCNNEVKYNEGQNTTKSIS